MKQYIKPTTSVNEIALACYMITGSDGTGEKLFGDSKSTKDGFSGEVDTKSRDVWSEGYW